MAARAHLPSETLCRVWPFCAVRHDGDCQNWWVNIRSLSESDNKIQSDEDISQVTAFLLTYQVTPNYSFRFLLYKFRSTVTEQFRPVKKGFFSGRKHKLCHKLNQCIWQNVFFIFLTDHLSNFISGPQTIGRGINVLPRKCLQFHSSHVNILVYLIVFVVERTLNSDWICFLSAWVWRKSLI